MLGVLIVIPDVTIDMAGLLQLQDFQIRRQAGVIAAVIAARSNAMAIAARFAAASRKPSRSTIAKPAEA